MNKVGFNITLVALSISASQLALANHTVIDQHHQQIKSTLHHWSNNIDDWFGTTDPSKPATANLRVIFDNQWNRYDGYSIKPRVRAKIKLPTLKKRFSIVIGDEDLDNQARDKNRTQPNYREPLDKNKNYDGRQTRQANSSFAIRWSEDIKSLGIDTDFDIGIRSGSDVFARLKASKVWQHTEQYTTRLEQIYRYGINSKHYLRTNLENKFTETARRFVNNHTFLEYTHDIDENIIWGNSLYRQHNYSNYKQLNYGLFVGGELEKKKFDVTHYGPFINYRQPIWRQWLFFQPELNYYNSKKLNRKHTLGAFLRVEAIF